MAKGVASDEPDDEPDDEADDDSLIVDSPCAASPDDGSVAVVADGSVVVDELPPPLPASSRRPAAEDAWLPSPESASPEPASPEPLGYMRVPSMVVGAAVGSLDVTTRVAVAFPAT